MTMMAARWGATFLWAAALATLCVELLWLAAPDVMRSVLFFLLIGAGTLSVSAVSLRLIDFHKMTYAMGRMQGVLEEQARTAHAQHESVVPIGRAKNG